MANKAAKFFDPVSGTFVAFDCVTGKPVPIDKLYDCPEYNTDWESVCIQPTGNTDPANVVPGWCVTVSHWDEVNEVLVVDSVQVFDASKQKDLTGDYEVTECVSSDLIPVGTSCYTANIKREDE